MRFKYDRTKSRKLKQDKRRGVSFKEIQEIWRHCHFVDYRLDIPEQYRAIGWVKGALYSVIYETREDEEGEYYHLVTLWKSTQQEKALYESHIKKQEPNSG